MLRKASITPQGKGSQHEVSRAGATGSDAGERSSGKSSSLGSGLSTSNTYLSSAGGKSCAKSPAQGE